MNKYTKLLISIAMPLLAGTIGSAFTITSIGSWYQTIVKPSFNPPNWVFGPVWTTLYILMGLALWLVWQKGLKKEKYKEAFKYFVIQLIFNSIWSITFFGMQSPGLALLVIAFLWALILITIIRFYAIKKMAAYLLIPYLLWVSFASILNFAIWQLN